MGILTSVTPMGTLKPSTKSLPLQLSKTPNTSINLGYSSIFQVKQIFLKLGHLNKPRRKSNCAQSFHSNETKIQRSISSLRTNRLSSSSEDVHFGISAGNAAKMGQDSALLGPTKHGYILKTSHTDGAATEDSVPDNRDLQRNIPRDVCTLGGLLFASMAVTAVFTVPAHAAVAEKKQKEASRKAAKKTTRVMDYEERKKWVEDLPLVRQKLAYTELLKLKTSGKLKAIVKHPNAKITNRPEACLVVRSDNAVFRTVLPTPDRDVNFWKSWNALNLSELVIEAYTPPPPPPAPEPWVQWGPSFTTLSAYLNSLLEKKPEGKNMRTEEEEEKRRAAEQVKAKAAEAERKKRRKKMTAAEREEEDVKERIRKLEEERRQLEEEEREREKRVRMERVERERMEREAKAERKRLEKEEERKREREEAEERKMVMRERQAKKAAEVRKQKVANVTSAQEAASMFWRDAASNEFVRFVIGVLFFVGFYVGVVLNVKKRKKDYEDRIKMKKIEEEERMKMEQLENGLLNLELTDEEKENLTDEQKKMLEEEEKNPMFAASRKFMRSGAKVKLGRVSQRVKRGPEFMDTGDEIRFDDVAGLGDIRRELEEVVEFFVNAEKYRRRGSRIPTGILLCGEPGVGKTMLAKAVAGEAGVNFFSISASQFVEVYVGVGAARVRALYNEAREYAPAVVFIDELDAVGRQRGLTQGSGGEERDATLNQLLTCLDGFDGIGDIITIAATNRIDVLDSALIRPGRFDRKILVPLPSLKGRAEILKVHARGKPLADDVDFDDIAAMTEGMSGAQLANVVDVAALGVLREGRSEVTTDDLADAVLAEEGGQVSVKPRSPHVVRQVAFCEAATVAVAGALPDFRNIELVTTVAKKGETKGSTKVNFCDPCLGYLDGVTKQSLKDYITVQMAPMLADEMWHGKEMMTTVWADSVDRARKTARAVIMQGLSDNKQIYAMYESWQPLSRVEMVDVEARKLLDSCSERAKQILERNREVVDETFRRLLEKKTLDASEVEEIFTLYGDYDKLPPTLFEVRERHVAEFKRKLEQVA